MDVQRTLRFTSAAGLAVVLMSVVASIVLPLSDAPDTSASASTIAAYVSENRGELLFVLYMSALAFALQLAFLAGLRDLLRRAEGAGGDVLPALGYGAGVVVVTVLLVGFALFVAAAYRVGDASEDLVRGLYDAGWATFALSSLPTAISIGAFSLVVLRTGYLPAWVGWFGVVAAAAHLVAGGAFADSDGALSLQGEVAIYTPLTFYLWVLVTSVGLARRTATPAQ